MIFTLRCLAVWATTSAVTSAVAAWSCAAVEPTAELDAMVTNVAGVALAVCAVWAWLVCSVVVALALRPGPRSTAPRVTGVPTWAARLVLAACGLATTAVGPAYATDGAPPLPRVAPQSVAPLDGLPFPDRPIGPARAATLADRAPVPSRAARADPDRDVVVRAGDSLWRIAADRLPSGAPDRAVADEVAALVRLNHDAIGPDPDLIHPGLRLHVPAHAPPLASPHDPLPPTTQEMP